MKDGAFLMVGPDGISYTELLEREVMQLRARLSRAENREQALETDNKKLAKEVTRLKKKQFTASSERLARLANEPADEDTDFGADGDYAPDEVLKEVPVRASVRRIKKKGPNTNSLSAYLNALEPEEIITKQADPPECSQCGNIMQIIGWNSQKELVVVPARVYAREYRTPVFGCKECEKNSIQVPVVREEKDLVRPLPGVLAAPETLAMITLEKALLGMPLYRQERSFAEMGLPLSRETMSNWFLAAAEKWLVPLAECMRLELLAGDIIHSDETSFQVLKEPGRKPESKGYAWIACSPFSELVRYVLIYYDSSHGAAVPAGFLGSFQGILSVDGFSAYRSLIKRFNPGITLSGCWAHCRREWFRALQDAPPDSPVWVGWKYVQKLFAWEEFFEDMTLEERFEARQKHVKPLLDEFKKWLSLQFDGQTGLGRAVKYTKNQWNELYAYLKDKRLSATNAAAELVARSIAVGRKNYLFSATPETVKPLMAACSVVETARANNLNVFEYLTWIFRELPRLWDSFQPELQLRLERAEAEAVRDYWLFVPRIREEVRSRSSPAFPEPEVEALVLNELRRKIVPELAAHQQALVHAEGLRQCARAFLPGKVPDKCKTTIPKPPKQFHLGFKAVRPSDH